MDKSPRNKQGLCHGYWEIYHKNGNLFYKGNFINNKEEGYWEDYFSNGKLWRKGNFINGREIGLWEIYNMNGKLNNITYYLV